MGPIDVDSAEWRELRTLFGGYLHQDFDLEHGSPWGAVRAYADESSTEELAVAVRLLRRLTSAFDDDELVATVDRFGMSVHPPGDGYSSYRVWLTGVAEFLEDPEAHPGPPERDAPLPPRKDGAGGRVSTFTDRDVAERAVAENLRANQLGVDAWLTDPAAGPNRAFEHRHATTIGRLAPVDATLETIHDVERSRVVLRRTDETPEGWFLLTAHPVDTDPSSPVARRIDRAAPQWIAVWDLCAGYLHQDFDIHGGVDDAVAAYLAEAPPGSPAAAAAGLRRILEHDDADLPGATEWLGMDYHPLHDGHSFRSWITTLTERLERHGVG